MVFYHWLFLRNWDCGLTVTYITNLALLTDDLRQKKCPKKWNKLKYKS